MTDVPSANPPQQRLAQLVAQTSQDMTRFLEERATLLDQRSQLQRSGDRLDEAWRTYRQEQLQELLQAITRLTEDALAQYGLVGYQLDVKLSVIAAARSLAAQEWTNAGGATQEPTRRPFQGTPEQARPPGRVKRVVLNGIHYLLEQVDNVGDSAAGVLPILEPFLELKKVLESLIGVSAELSSP